MRFCTNCNRVLQDNDTICPHCADGRAENAEANAATPTGAPGNQTPEALEDVRVYRPKKKRGGAPRDVAQNDQAQAPDIMQIASTVRATRETGERSWDSDAARRAATNSFTIEIPLNQGILESSASEEESELDQQTTDIPALAEDGSEAALPSQTTEDFDFKGTAIQDSETGAIERALEEDEVIEQAVIKKSGPSKLEITLILILAAAVVVFGVLIAVKLFSTNQPVPEDYNFEQFVGTWISDYFYFDDGSSEAESVLYCEQLIIRADGTFTRRYLVVNRAIPDGYLTGEWEIEEEISGTIQFFEDSRTLALIWEEERTIFDRYILSMDDTHMELREYYDEEHLDFFDMIFTRV